MPENQDFADLFRILNEEQVEYLVVGAHAVVYFTEPRYTKDLDIWVRPSPDNAEKVWRALAKFGAPLKNIGKSDFLRKDMVYQIGIAPNRIDILMGIAGVEFEEAWQNRVDDFYGKIPIHILGRNEIIKAKTASGRPEDLLDLKRLMEFS